MGWPIISKFEFEELYALWEQKDTVIHAAMVVTGLSLKYKGLWNLREELFELDARLLPRAAKLLDEILVDTPRLAVQLIDGIRLLLTAPKGTEHKQEEVILLILYRLDEVARLLKVLQQSYPEWQSPAYQQFHEVVIGVRDYVKFLWKGVARFRKEEKLFPIPVWWWSESPRVLPIRPCKQGVFGRIDFGRRFLDNDNIPDMTIQLAVDPKIIGTHAGAHLLQCDACGLYVRRELDERLEASLPKRKTTEQKETKEQKTQTEEQAKTEETEETEETRDQEPNTES